MIARGYRLREIYRDRCIYGQERGVYSGEAEGEPAKRAISNGEIEPEPECTDCDTGSED